MPRRTEYEDAKRDYKSVKYSPFGNEPGDPFVLTSDPWHYLKAWLRQEHNVIKKKTRQKERLGKAIYFAELAENFQKAADLTVLPTKGTLTYYSILNLVKSYLLTIGYDLETNIEYHGLSLPADRTDELKVSAAATGGGINIFHEFASQCGCVAQPGSPITLKEMVSEIPEIHEMCFNLGKLSTTKRKFLPIEIRIITNKITRSHLTYEFAFEKKNSNVMRTEKFNEGVLATKLEKLDDDPLKPHWLVYRAKKKWTYTRDSDRSWINNYQSICDEIKNLNVAQMLTRQGYRYYANLQPGAYRPLVSFFALMYYIGSVARYRPTLNQTILEGDYSAILNEVMMTGPKQFLYHMVSKITRKVCAVPMAKID